jgi:transposase-like protein
MTARYASDCCPACGSSDVLPYAVIVGGSEEYGYQCLACEVTWPVLTHGLCCDAGDKPPLSRCA